MMKKTTYFKMPLFYERTTNSAQNVFNNVLFFVCMYVCIYTRCINVFDS